MSYDINLVEMACNEHGLRFTKEGEIELRIKIANDVTMIVANTEDGDTYWGFTDVPWHTHDELSLSLGGSNYRDYLPEDLIVDWSSGEVLLVSLEKSGEIVDRWFVHKNDCSVLKNIELGESMHFETASNKAGGPGNSLPGLRSNRKS